MLKESLALVLVFGLLMIGLSAFKKKFYKNREKALDSIKQQEKNWQTPIYRNHKFRLIPVFKGIPEEIDNQIKQIKC